MEGFKQEKPLGRLTVVVESGLFLCGRMDGSKLMRPRVLTFRQDGKIDMKPLPLLPPFISIPKAAWTYHVPEREKDFVETYNRITSALVDPNG